MWRLNETKFLCGLMSFWYGGVGLTCKIKISSLKSMNGWKSSVNKRVHKMVQVGFHTMRAVKTIHVWSGALYRGPSNYIWQWTIVWGRGSSASLMVSCTLSPRCWTSSWLDISLIEIWVKNGFVVNLMGLMLYLSNLLHM